MGLNHLLIWCIRDLLAITHKDGRKEIAWRDNMNPIGPFEVQEILVICDQIMGSAGDGGCNHRVVLGIASDDTFAKRFIQQNRSALKPIQPVGPIRVSPTDFYGDAPGDVTPLISQPWRAQRSKASVGE